MKQHPSMTSVSLHNLADQLIKGLLPVAVDQRNLIINDIDRELVLQTDENMLAFVLWNLLDRVVYSTREESIHIGATKKADRTEICVSDAGSYFYRSLTNSFRQVQHAAEKLGGNIVISSTPDQGTVIVFSLSSKQAAA